MNTRPFKTSSSNIFLEETITNFSKQFYPDKEDAQYDHWEVSLWPIIHCPICYKTGYHSYLFHSPIVEFCPFHNCTLLRYCTKCSEPWTVPSIGKHSHNCDECSLDAWGSVQRGFIYEEEIKDFLNGIRDTTCTKYILNSTINNPYSISPTELRIDSYKLLKGEDRVKYYYHHYKIKPPKWIANQEIHKNIYKVIEGPFCEAQKNLSIEYNPIQFIDQEAIRDCFYEISQLISTHFTEFNDVTSDNF